MCNLEKFVPSIFKSLSSIEKEDAVIDFANNLFQKFNLNPIHITFDPYESDFSCDILGKFSFVEPFIFINPAFFYKGSDFYKLFTSLDEAEKYVPYYLVHTIAHECVHYYQHNLVKQLVNGDSLSKEEKNFAYLCFICTYNKAFSSLNSKLHFAHLPNIDTRVTYIYSPLEMQSNTYGVEIAKKLGNIDPNNNYNDYQKTQLFSTLSDTEYDYAKIGKIITKTIDYNLELALAFLNYKNKGSNSFIKYLNIDCKELKKSIKNTLKIWEENKEKQNNGFNYLIKKIKR